MTKNFSYDKYPSREMKYVPSEKELIADAVFTIKCLVWAALIGWTLFLLTAFHCYVLPHLI